MRAPMATFPVLAALAGLSGCSRSPAPAPASPPASVGRIVPAVLASFEQGAGGWLETSGRPVRVEASGGSRGARWLAAPVKAPSGETVVEVSAKVPDLDWTRFGDTLRADVRGAPAAGTVRARIVVEAHGQTEHAGPWEPVRGEWQTIAWKAGDALRDVAHIGVQYAVSGPWSGTLGLDNVRVGAAEGLSTAYSVAHGPFPTREAAVQAMQGLDARAVKSFPIYEEGWYLNLGTFRNRAGAGAEAKRLQGSGVKTTILVR